ncbi:hypothetical protein Tco_1339989 [Tanacetum coccineum]
MPATPSSRVKRFGVGVGLWCGWNGLDMDNYGLRVRLELSKGNGIGVFGLWPQETVGWIWAYNCVGSLSGDKGRKMKLLDSTQKAMQQSCSPRDAREGVCGNVDGTEGISIANEGDGGCDEEK